MRWNTVLVAIGVVGVTGCTKPKSAELPPIVTAIEGTVRDDASGALLDGVSVSTEPPTQVVTTTDDGTFSIVDGIEPRMLYRVTATKAGYLPAQSGFATIEGNTSSIDLVMIPAEPILALTRDDIDFGPFNSEGTFAISNVGDVGTELSYSISSAQAWTSASPANGTVTETAAVVHVSVDRSALGTVYGARSATVSVTSDGGTADFIVRLYHPDPNAPLLSASPELLDFGLAGLVRTLTLRNAGTGNLNWQATSDATWLTITPPDGALSQAAMQRLEVRASRSTLATGINEATVIISDADGNLPSKTIQVRVDVGGFPVTLTSENVVDFGTSALTRRFDVFNGGGGSLRFEIVPPAVQWFTITQPAAGRWHTIAEGATMSVELSIVRDTQSIEALAPGTHEFALLIRSDENLANEVVAGGNRYVLVRAETVQTPVLDSVESNMALYANDAQELTLLNTGVGVLEWTVTSAPSWATLSPEAGAIETPFGAAAQSATILISSDSTGISPGAHSESVTFSYGGGEVVVPVELRVPGALWVASSATGPNARRSPALAALNDNIFGTTDFILFGGETAAGYVDDTWAFTVASGWSSMSPTATPGVRGPVRFATTTNRAALYSPPLYGGGQLSLTLDGAHPWLLDLDDPSRWLLQELCDFQSTPEVAPCAADANDGLSRTGMRHVGPGMSTVYFGGLNAAETTAVNTVTRIDFAGRSDVGAFPNPIVDASILSYDDGATPMVLVVATPCASTDPASCKGTAIYRGPSPHQGTGLVYTEVPFPDALERSRFTAFERNNAIYLLGGVDASGAYLSDLVRVDADGTVESVTPWGAPPSPRADSSAAYLSRDDMVVVFAGENSSAQLLSDTWILEFVQ